MSHSKREVRFNSIDPLWWGVAGGLALGSLWFAQILNMQGSMKTLMLEVLLLLAGAIIGALRPQRVWRWGVAALLAFVISDLLQLSAKLGGQVDPAVVLSFLSAHGIDYIARGLPLLVGAYVGSTLIESGME